MVIGSLPGVRKASENALLVSYRPAVNVGHYGQWAINLRPTVSNEFDLTFYVFNQHFDVDQIENNFNIIKAQVCALHVCFLLLDTQTSKPILMKFGVEIIQIRFTTASERWFCFYPDLLETWTDYFSVPKNG